MTLETLPVGWVQKPLGQVSKPGYGKALDSTLRKTTGNFPVVGSAGVMAFTDSPLVGPGTLVVGRKGNIGQVHLLEKGGWPIDTVYFLKVPPAFDSRYLALVLESLELRRLNSSTTTPSLRREDLEAVLVPVCSLEEQERIVEILEEQLSRLDAAVKSVQTVREKAAQFRRSLLHAAFAGRLTQPANACDGTRQLGGTIPDGWDVASLAEIESRGLVKIGRGKIISKRDIASTPGDYPIYSSASLNGGEFGRYGKYLFDEELITWSIDGGGRLFHRDKHKFSVTNVGGWIRILKQETFGYKFLFLALSYLHSNVIFDWSRKAHPSVIRLVYDAIPIPPMKEQRQIVSILDENLSRLDQVLGVADEIERRANALRRSLLHAAFTGELTRSWRESHV